LRAVPLTESRDVIGGGRPLATRTASGQKAPIGETPTVLLRADHTAAYPVVDGYPVLLGPEVLTATATAFDLVHSHYAEAYLETAFYNAEATAKAEQIRQHGLASSSSEGVRWLDRLRQLPALVRHQFPEPSDVWLVDRMDLGANWDCHTHIGSVRDQRVVQVGGSGIHVLALLLAGAREGWLVTPMVGEARLASALAEALGLHLECVIGIGEEMPFASGWFDVVVSAGCVHHMATDRAPPEMARVLASGGRFAALEPWRAPLYAIGTRIMGKREANAFCRPLTDERVAPLFTAFPSARVVQHGTFARYAMLALERFGARFSLPVAWRVGQWDDRVSDLLRLRRFGSSVALLGATRL
jgi:hypothetical protein